MVPWSGFHKDPRTSYYLFLRQNYACAAHVAYARVKRVDTMVTSLDRTPRELAALSSLSSLTRLLEVATNLKWAARRVRSCVLPKLGRASQDGTG